MAGKAIISRLFGSPIPVLLLGNYFSLFFNFPASTVGFQHHAGPLSSPSIPCSPICFFFPLNKLPSAGCCDWVSGKLQIIDPHIWTQNDYNITVLFGGKHISSPLSGRSEDHCHHQPSLSTVPCRDTGIPGRWQQRHSLPLQWISLSPAGRRSLVGYWVDEVTGLLGAAGPGWRKVPGQEQLHILS